jgi:uncharacterized protein YpmS
MKNTIKILLLITALVVVIGLACKLPFSIAPKNSEETPSYDVADAWVVEDTIQQAITQPGQFAFTLTEAQLTSYLTLKLAETQEDITARNVVVKLDDDQITITADLTFEATRIQVPVVVVVSGSTTEDGMLVFDLDDISVGNLTLPAGFADTVSAMLIEAINSNLGQRMEGFKVTTLYIDEGMITIAGSKR